MEARIAAYLSPPTYFYHTRVHSPLSVRPTSGSTTSSVSLETPTCLGSHSLDMLGRLMCNTSRGSSARCLGGTIPRARAAHFTLTPTFTGPTPRFVGHGSQQIADW
jgi:hypothetical protein